MIHDHQLLEKFRTLSQDKQSEVIDFIEFLQAKQNPRTSEPLKQWKTIAGIAPTPMMNQDAQEWVSFQRQDADQNRSLS